MQLETCEFEHLALIRDVQVPTDIRFREILVTGPPGSGKSSLVAAIRGWPEEGFLDLGQDKWWRGQLLAFRPREIHLGFPVAGHEKGLAVTDAEWIATNPALQLERIRIPPGKRGWFSVNWRNRYVFDFQLPGAAELFEARSKRARAGTHPVDKGLTLELVTRQLEVYQRVALHMQRAGMPVYVREQFGGPPRRIVEPGQTSDETGEKVSSRSRSDL